MRPVAEPGAHDLQWDEDVDQGEFQHEHHDEHEDAEVVVDGALEALKEWSALSNEERQAADLLGFKPQDWTDHLAEVMAA